MFDSHTHTSASHDANCPAEALCDDAVQRGLRGVTITDHCDMEYCKEQNMPLLVSHSVQEALRVREKYASRLNVLLGVEIGEGFWFPKETAEITASFPFDAVLGSVHAVRLEGLSMPYSLIDFSGFSEAALRQLLSQYFEDMLAMAEEMDFDILTHLTCPLRYINGKYRKNISYAPYLPSIERLLKKIISRGIALELNASGLGTPWNTLMPDQRILELYRALGGTLITLGSDSHTADRAGYGLAEAANLLKRCGFSGYAYYRARRPVFMEL